jgi:hypothetical protein
MKQKKKLHKHTIGNNIEVLCDYYSSLDFNIFNDKPIGFVHKNWCYGMDVFIEGFDNLNSMLNKTYEYSISYQKNMLGWYKKQTFHKAQVTIIEIEKFDRDRYYHSQTYKVGLTMKLKHITTHAYLMFEVFDFDKVVKAMIDESKNL